MEQRHYEIFSVFDKWLGRRAREMEGTPGFRIIPVGEFPDGAPLHEDGSTEYDPRKPLVLFAVELSGKRAIAEWAKVTREFDALVSA